MDTVHGGSEIEGQSQNNTTISIHWSSWCSISSWLELAACQQLLMNACIILRLRAAEAEQDYEGLIAACCTVVIMAGCSRLVADAVPKQGGHLTLSPGVMWPGSDMLHSMNKAMVQQTAAVPVYLQAMCASGNKHLSRNDIYCNSQWQPSARERRQVQKSVTSSWSQCLLRTGLPATTNIDGWCAQ